MLKYRDVEKEKSLLSLLIKSRRGDKHRVLNQLDSSSFSTIASKETFILVKDYYQKYQAPLNKEIILSIVENLPARIRNKVKRFIKVIVKRKGSWKTIDWLVEELLYYEGCRSVQKMLISAKDIFKENGDPYLVKSFLMDMITQSEVRAQGDVEVLDVRSDFLRRFRFIKKAKKEGVRNRGIASGIDDRFDDETSGYGPGDLVIFVAQTSGGKSLGMQDQACYIAIEEGKKVAYISNEMDPTQIAFRMDSRITEIRHRKFKKPVLMRALDLKKWKISMKELKKDRIKIIGMTGGNCSAAAIHNKLKEIGFKPDIIFIDYINNMVPNSSQLRDTSSLDWQPQGMILRETKNLGLSRKVPVISAGQLKPDSYEKEDPSFADIAINKQALITNADVLTIIVQTKAMKMLNPPRARILFLKVREGKTRDFIEIIPDFGVIRLHNPKKKRKKKKRRKQ